MHRQHVAPQTQNERTSSLVRGTKRRTGAKIAAFGVSALVAGQLLLPGAALATETPELAAGQGVAATIAGSVETDITKPAAETAAAAPNAVASTAAEAESSAAPALASEVAPTASIVADKPAAAAVAPANEPTAAPAPTPESAATVSASAVAPATRGATTPGGGEIRIDATVVNHFYDLELPPAFTLVQDEAFVYDFPDAPENFTLWHNESVHLFKIDPDTESLVKTDNTKEANVSISLASVDNHERATLVFTGGGADPLISYSLNLFHSIYIGAGADFDFGNFNNGEGAILETRHEYYIRCVFGSNVYLIGTDTTEPGPDVKPNPEEKPNPEVKPDPEVKPETEVKPDPETKPEPAPQPEAEKPAADTTPAKVTPVVKPAESALPATGDNGAMAVALGAAGAAAAAAAASVAAARRRNR